MQKFFKSTFRYCALSIVLLFPFFSTFSSAAPLKVGVYPCPPFVIGSMDNEWDGLSIELWEKIAQNMGVEFTVENHPLDDLLSSIETGQIDIGVSCISITPERELFADFSHSFYETHLAIAVKKKGYLETLHSIFLNPALWLIIGVIVFVAGAIGAFFYALEHGENEKLYSMKSRTGRWLESFILGLLFITRGPFNYFEFKSLTGRIATVFIGVFSMLFIASITAVLASKLTLSQGSSQIKGINDLANVKVGVKVATTSSLLLTSFGIRHENYIDMPRLLVALEEGEVDAIVADDVVLKYMIGNGRMSGQFEDLEVLPYQLEKQNYGFIITENNPYEEEINRALLQIRESRKWRKILVEYFADK
ncbi:polar amino acid transport system substrate-binding protein [Vibrio crassostreae]|uniref:transporter substrate-binding domain-containing protein n=1 Tax=Vibrio crassostreae TaxID=246167 RepID=UPI0010442942|nr:transporter substrate-binding domain-containing protein [Vibrio crassostreae]TCT75817.1 amino acid ABC transporter substrate-binding protein (PAAT family) [Vibrio crassostreae]CAK1851002.1 polar amino acid transport system substrate-binding protein [Vibrio crassostreae]CAK2128236.1 polar amino acid transport system substrate-binding protein [Vibrio crassostreae]CAK2142550.1 polar amino acid transport system substrate-binding protein [Vibrio crassostreae]CAK2149587.1 polar amino acid transpo